jgi:hypothetical protein
MNTKQILNTDISKVYGKPLKYDDNGFLEEGEYELDDRGIYTSLSCTNKNVQDNTVTYDLNIYEASCYHSNISKGTVKLTKIRDNLVRIDQEMCDRYDVCFDIKPCHYMDALYLYNYVEGDIVNTYI